MGLGLEGDKGDTLIARGEPTEPPEVRSINASAHDLLIAHLANNSSLA
jgi:hypothetical protein